MATKIRLIPTLEGKTAKDFVEKADRNLSNKGTIDFSKQVNAVHKILKGFYSIKTQ